MDKPEIDLQPFCSQPDDPRDYLRQPFSFDKFTCASNGHIAVIVARRDDAEDLTKAEWLDRYLAYLKETLQRRGQESALLRLKSLDLDLSECSECHGSGKTFPCLKCRGNSELDWDCLACDGTGTLSPLEYEQVKPKWFYWAIAPGICQTCLGVGKQGNKKTLLIGDAHFQSRYLLLAKTLPNAQIHTFGKRDAALIDFADGFALIMPMRVDCYITEVHK